LRELVPAAARVAVLVDPTFPLIEHQVREAHSAARTMGLQIQILNASTSAEIGAAFAMLRERFDALYVGASPFFATGVFNWRCWLGAMGSRDVRSASVYRSRRADELRS
jgi:ABC-type uncharacterized transport system substrate-binding protein